MSDGADWRQQEESEQQRFETEPPPFSPEWMERMRAAHNELEAILWSLKA